VHVDNRAVNATSIHFHGLFQNGTNDMDGSVGITQCAIPPGYTFTYNFTVAGQSGTYWYHAHHAVQASDGLLGPMIIHSKDEKTLQELHYASDRVIMVQDHYHNTTAELLMDYLRPRSENDEPVPDNALINGRGVRDCKDFPGWPCDTTDRGVPEIYLAPGQRHRLRFINVGAFAEFQIEIDQHEFHVTEVDGTDVHPEPFHRLNILPAQRYSIVVEANNTAAESFWMRTRMVTHCFTTENERLEPDLNVIVRYGSPDKDESRKAPTSKPWSEAIEVICRDLNTSALHPVVHITPPPADDFISLRANFMIGDWKLSRGFFNDSTWHANMTHPSLHRLLDANLTTHSSDIEGIQTNTDPFDATKDFVLQTNGIRTVDIAINSFDDGSHPFHLHGHKFFILAQARSGYPPSTASEVNTYLEQNSHVLENPLRRDVVTVEGYAWTLVRVVLDNPGLWAFHCHNSWHAAAGMVMQVLGRRDDVLGPGRGVGEEQRGMCRQDGVKLGDRPDDSIWYGDFS
jgi:FtsP/CotA-like multicopper oxidase with cupredoxin domain